MKWGLLLITLIVLTANFDLKARDITFKDKFISNNDSIVIPENKSVPDSANRIPRHYEEWSEDKVQFKGHLLLFEIGVNSFAKTNYSGYAIPDFMDLDQNKSYEVNIYILRYSLGLQKFKNCIGLVTGMGFNFNDYRFSNPYTIANESGHITPILLDENGLSKTKLSTTYLTVPLLIEFQIPVNGQDKRVYFSGGIIGGLGLSSHTKVKRSGNKVKNHDGFNLSPFRYGATFRIGYKDINLFATYYHTTLFKEGRGPEMFPFTIGIGLINSNR
jgi:hypothetical protein